MNNSKPFFTIGICSFKRPLYLAESINSVLSNTYQDFEIIISDDCSPNIDEIREALRPFRNHEKINIFFQENNLGWSDNRNFIKNIAKGKYTIIIGDDDLFFPDSLAILSKEIKLSPNKELYLFGFELIDESGKKINSFYSPQYYNFNYKNYDIVKRILKADLFPFWFFHPLTLCFNTNNMKDILFNKNAFIGDDYLFLYDSIFNKKEFRIIPKKIFQWRKIQKQSKESFTNIIRSYNIEDKVLYDFIKSQHFEDNFLFKSILIAKISSEIILEKFGNNFYSRYLNYKKNTSWIQKTIEKFIDYLIFTKFKGLIPGLIFAFERIKYRYSFFK